ncbi:MAG: ORF6N domain-containing protein, partial [Bacteroidetes bacterium]
MNQNNQIISIDNIQNRIYTIRGLQVMLDRDLAFFYEVKAIR